MTQSPIKAVLFDKDGTLIDYHLSWGPINRRSADFAAGGDAALARRLLELGGMDAETGITRADSLLAAANTREIAEAWAAAGAKQEAGALTRGLDAIFTEAASRAVPVTDLAALFQELRRRGFWLGLASSDSEAAIRATLARFGIAEHVAYVAGYDSGYGTKPGPGMLLGFAQATGLPPAQIAVVGDNLHDMEMARSGGAGLRIGVLTGTGGREALSAAAHLCLPSVEGLWAHL